MAMKLTKILVPTDFSDASRRAFEQAVALASGHDITIHLLHRMPSPIPLFSPTPGVGGGSYAEIGRLLEDYTKELKRDAEEKLAQMASGTPKGVSVVSSLSDSMEPHEAVLRKAKELEADLIAMGTHGRQGLDKLLMGSVAARVLHHAETHVMLLRADSALFGADSRGPVLVPVDFSDYSHRALAFARLIASSYGCSIHLLHVVELLQTPLKPAGLTSRFEEEPGLKDKYLEALKDMLGDTEGEVTVAEGSIAGEILWSREKLGAELVVMGSRGLSGLAHLLIGSVAEKVARFSEVPVIVVK
jgi:nucleotide-binding universal stress UspA family protein